MGGWWSTMGMGVTRATRMAKLAPGVLVTVEVIGSLRRAYPSAPTIEETL